MTYDEAIAFLYEATPAFQNIGGAAYKPGLETTLALAEAFGNPQEGLRCIHVAGTNGKGSTCHTLAAVLQASGYRTGLFTSPHLIDFRERIRINGQPISADFVIDFTEQARKQIDRLSPSFFELTTVMALSYFRAMEVDIAVMEVGMGGRLDSTNIVTPSVCVITGISADHTEFLGNTLEEIAAEKAGIIKPHIPVVIGEASPSLRAVFSEKAKAVGAEAVFYAEDSKLIHRIRTVDARPVPDICIKAEGAGSPIGSSTPPHYLYETSRWGDILGELAGEIQPVNTRTVLTTLSVSETYGCLPAPIPAEAVRQGFASVVEMTGLLGRWQVIDQMPLTICDTAHNAGGIAPNIRRLRQIGSTGLHIVFGMASDKDIAAVLDLLPREAVYYFCQATGKRALQAEALQALAGEKQLFGKSFPRVTDAYKAAREAACRTDVLYIGGSNFVVADLLVSLMPEAEKQTK